jgi:hypothetical protein
MITFDAAVFISYFPWENYIDFEAFILALVCLAMAFSWISWLYTFHSKRKLRRTSIDVHTIRNRTKDNYISIVLNLLHTILAMASCSVLVFWNSYMETVGCDLLDGNSLFCSADSSALPSLQTMLLMLFPLSYQILINGSNYKILLFLWTLSFLTTLLSMIIFTKYSFGSYMLLYMTLHIGVLMMEIRRQTIDTFYYFVSEMKLMEEVLLSRFKSQDEKTKSDELRRMIGTNDCIIPRLAPCSCFD